MIASRIGRAGTRFGPTRFGGSSSAMIGSAIAHSSSGTRQIGGNGGRSFFFLAILHLRLSRPCRPGASLEIVTKPVEDFLITTFEFRNTGTEPIRKTDIAPTAACTKVDHSAKLPA